ncbi:MAG: putative ABC transporter ATP-binding protein YheS [Syntrophorhabdaceae bacterium PtaU1.Bin034]|nr:MAG: putative ABC transporter ATP-binding protein YheS [Syntrophorhabdaceae bacterium PtaU1.Bin034]
MFSVSNLTKTYGLQVVFDNITFTVNQGERIGLVGRNGSGKTTLLRLIVGEEEPDSGTINTPRNYSIGYLSQVLSFTQGTVLKEASLGLKPSEDGTDQTYRVKSILLGLGIDQADFHRAPKELSSGYQIRLNLAKVLVSDPDLLLLDEPTNYLDIVSVRWLGQFLRQWKNELIVITHDRAFMDSVVTHVMGIHRYGIRKIAGSTHKLYEQILQEEEVYEKTRINDERKRHELEQFINRFRAQASRAKAVQSKIRLLEKRKRLDKLVELRNLDFQFPAAPFTGKWLIEVRDLAFSYNSGPALMRHLTFSIGRRDRIGVIGKNGKGKTTLLTLLAGGLEPGTGTISRSSNVKIGYFGQANIDRLNLENTIEDEIMRAHPDSSRGAARNMAGVMLFDGDKALKKISVLSGGEKSRVLLGKMLVEPANLLLLDEPTNHLDMESIDSLIEAVDAFEGAAVIATHSEMVLNAIAEKLIIFDGGNTWLFEGSYQDFLDRVGWQDEEMIVRQSDRAEEKKWQRTEKKEIKRMRAELISERSRALSPLERDIARIEKSIIELEERVQADNIALLRASQTGEGNTIVALSVSIHDAKKKIEELFEQLETVSTEHAVLAREFEIRFEELEQKKKPSETCATSSSKYL